MNAYILTRQHNDYDQHGEYFVAWFVNKPTIAALKSAMVNDEEGDADDATAEHVLSGGGRRNVEGVWWHLRLVASG